MLINTAVQKAARLCVSMALVRLVNTLEHSRTQCSERSRTLYKNQLKTQTEGTQNNHRLADPEPALRVWFLMDMGALTLQTHESRISGNLLETFAFLRFIKKSDPVLFYKVFNLHVIRFSCDF